MGLWSERRGVTERYGRPRAAEAEWCRRRRRRRRLGVFRFERRPRRLAVINGSTAPASAVTLQTRMHEQKIRKFKTDEFDSKTNGIFGSCNWCKRIETSRLHGLQSYNLHLFHVSNLSVLNFRIFCSCIRGLHRKRGDGVVIRWRVARRTRWWGRHTEIHVHKVGSEEMRAEAGHGNQRCGLHEQNTPKV